MAQAGAEQDKNLDLQLAYGNVSSLARKSDMLDFFQADRKTRHSVPENHNRTRTDSQASREREAPADKNAGRRNPYLAGLAGGREVLPRNRKSAGRGELDLIWGEERKLPEKRTGGAAERGTAPAAAERRPTYPGAGTRPAGGPRRQAEEGYRPAGGPRRQAEEGYRPVGGPRRQAEEGYRPAGGPRRQAEEGYRPAGGPCRQAEEGYRPAGGPHRQAEEGYRPAGGPRRQTGTGRPAVSPSALRVQNSAAGMPAKRRSLQGAGRALPQKGYGRAESLPRDYRKRVAQEQRRKEILRKKIIMGAVEAFVLVCIVVLAYFALQKPKTSTAQLPPADNQETEAFNQTDGNLIQGLSGEVFGTHPEWQEDFLTISEYSRPGEPLTEIKNIFVHYTANPGTSAAQNRSYFEQLKDTHERGASAHFIIGYDGEIIQCVPLDEIAYAVLTRNEDSISIECCYKAKDGSFTQETYDSLIKLLSWLTKTYGLNSEDILRHYDCGGKKCPLYYTEHEDAWEKLKADVRDYKL